MEKAVQPPLEKFRIKWEVEVAGLSRDEAIEFAYLSLITDPDLVVFDVTHSDGKLEVVSLASLLKELHGGTRILS